MKYALRSLTFQPIASKVLNGQALKTLLVKTAISQSYSGSVTNFWGKHYKWPKILSVNKSLIKVRIWDTHFLTHYLGSSLRHGIIDAALMNSYRILVVRQREGGEFLGKHSKNSSVTRNKSNLMKYALGSTIFQSITSTVLYCQRLQTLLL